ncbi:MAG TPA: class I SAM-dependent methyltransferase [Candidatus Atribacteria bacterium]|nr:class I SAM-dependent methyltransferase [Candidatus Atribacteria bacterium]
MSSINCSMNKHKKEIEQGNRFKFGENWARFLARLDGNQIVQAKNSLKQMLEVNDLNGRCFLDIGSGSGLFSLAARQLGARVHSFDYDPLSVACTMELRQCHFPRDGDWTIEQGDVLNFNYLGSLGQFDIVYSWGVLHHTGSMWEALGNVVPLVAEAGKLAISIYNDQGRASQYWAALKKFYNQSPKPLRMFIVLGVATLWFIHSAFGQLVRFQNPFPFKEWNQKKKERGMSVWHDLVDWVGGYPFEVAKPEAILDFYRGKGFRLAKLKTCNGRSGCNEFVFIREGKRTG